jgi:hypothetical protein
MSPTLIPGDFIFVNKMIPGPHKKSRNEMDNNRRDREFSKIFLSTLNFIYTFANDFGLIKSIFMKRILLILVALMFTVSIHAQLRFGIKAGANFSKFNSEEQILETDAAWQAGLAAQFKIPLIGLGIQPELLYSVNKGKDKSNGKDNSIGYFTVPVNLRWQPLPIPLIKPVILVGPYFKYAVNFKGFEDVAHLGNVKDDIKRFDWGIGLGGGIEIWKLQIEGRYNWGLQNISDDIKKFDLKSNVFTLSAIYFF